MELAEAIRIPRVNNVIMIKGPRKNHVGSLAILSHHLIFSQAARNAASEDFMLLHRTVDRITCDLVQRDQPARGGILTLKLKNFLIIAFEVPHWDQCQLAKQSIETLSNIYGCDHDYPFYYQSPFEILDDGWNAFDIEQEFNRIKLVSGDSFRISSVNLNYKVCRSYPEKVIVPKGIGDDYLRISATFRDGARFPILSYYHPRTKSCIFRSGQPLIGPTNRRCREDESILNSLVTLSRGIIFDTRHKSVAIASKSKGGGFEAVMHYSQWRYVTCPCPKISDIKESLTKLVDVCNDSGMSVDKYLSRLNQSQWQHSVMDMINAAANVAQCIESDATPAVPVLVHGGEGVDTTLATTSLAQLILDPDARTFRGFQSLIEREWIMAGHPFQLRNAHSCYAQGAVTGRSESPVFLCFLNAVYELMHQYPSAFEFDEHLLIFLFEHSYASEFGTFLGCNENEKAQKKIKERTVSLWSYINNPEVCRTFMNIDYHPNKGVIWPSILPQCFKLWDRLFFRWQRNWSETDGLRATLDQWKTKEKELVTKAVILKRQLAELMKETKSPKPHLLT
ncbi:unnamed protein product [Auanema sp. JU1783]|nr:unnamed protein product [Auanema sp. JU1783]